MHSKIKYSIFILLIGQRISAQCAMCKAVVESGNNSMSDGINNGILYLMAMPYLLVLIAGILFFKFYLTNKNLTH